MSYVPKEVQLTNFVAMYGHLALPVIQSYRRGGDPCVVLSDVNEGAPITPDMHVSYYAPADFEGTFNGELVTVRLMRHQFQTCDNSHQCVMGLRFPSGDILTHVIQIAPKK